MTSQANSYKPISLEINGVVKSIQIPFNSLQPSSTISAIAQNGSKDPNAVQPPRVYVLPASCKPQVIAAKPATPRAVATDATSVLSSNSPRLASLLSTVRFPTGSNLTRTVVAVRPKAPVIDLTASEPIKITPTEPIKITPSEPIKIAPSPVFAQPARIVRTPALAVAASGDQARLPQIVKTIPAGAKILTTVSRPEGAQLYRPAQLLRPIAPNIVRSTLPGSGSANVRYVTVPGSSAARTGVVSGAGAAGSPRKTVMIKIPQGSGQAGLAAARSMIPVKPGYTLIEVRDAESNVVRYIQVRKADTAAGMKKEDVSTLKADQSPEPEDASSSREAIKVIEIIPDEDLDTESGPADDTKKGEQEHDAPEEKKAALDGFKKKETELEGLKIKEVEFDKKKIDLKGLEEKDHKKTESGVKKSHKKGGRQGKSMRAELAMTKESGFWSPNSKSPRRGIFDALTHLTVDDARAAAAALVFPSDEQTGGSTNGSSPNSKGNVVLCGDDLVVIQNPEFRDDDDDDDDDNTISADEGSTSLLVINESPSTTQAGDDLPPMLSPEGKNSTVTHTKPLKRKNLARRTGGRPLSGFKNKAKRTGGRPMTIKERYGVKVKECYVSLETLYNKKPYDKWVDRHLMQILGSGDGKQGTRVKRSSRKSTVKSTEPSVPQIMGPSARRTSRRPKKILDIDYKDLNEGDGNSLDDKLSDASVKSNAASVRGSGDNLVASRKRLSEVLTNDVRRGRKRKSAIPIDSYLVGKDTSMSGKKKSRKATGSRRSVNLPPVKSDTAVGGKSPFTSRISDTSPLKIIVGRPSLPGATPRTSLPTTPSVTTSAPMSAGCIVVKSPTMVSPGSGQIVHSRSPGALTPTASGTIPTSKLPDTKYYLVKTDECSFLIPVSQTTIKKVASPGSNTDTTPTRVLSPPIASAVPVSSPQPATTSVKDKESPATAESADAAADAGSGDENKQDGEYEPAVSGMRQEDRISLLKEKLRMQQQRLDLIRKK